MVIDAEAIRSCNLVRKSQDAKHICFQDTILYSFIIEALKRGSALECISIRPYV